MYGVGGGVIWKMQRSLKKPLNEAQSNIAHDDNESFNVLLMNFLPSQKLKYTTTKTLARAPMQAYSSMFCRSWFVET